MTALCLLGLNHRSAPVALREQLAIVEERIPATLAALGKLAREAYVLSTCNRTELYVVADASAMTAVEMLQNFLIHTRGVSHAELQGHVYTHSDEDAVRHLLRVASGLDSMVLGEAQILGQVRDAYEAATAVGSIGPVLGKILPLALETGKLARSQTKISWGAISPSSVAVDLAKRALGDVHARPVLVIGAGEAGQATVRSLREAGVGHIVVVNRSFARAEELARQFGGRAALYEDLNRALEGADIVISSTASGQHIVTTADAHEVMKARAGRPLLCIDIAVPRDIDPEVGSIPGVHLYNVDDLEAVAAANLKDRRQEVPAVERIVDEGVADYRAWRSVQDVVPTIGELYQRAESIRRAEVERTVRRMPTLSQDERELIDLMTSAIVHRLLHGPVSVLKARNGDPGAEERARVVAELFALDGSTGEH
jgi:glutamyl-tRNA reductase